MSVFSGGLSKLLVSALAITGIAYPVYKLTNNHSTELVTTTSKESTKEQRISEDTSATSAPVEKKSCTVFLASTNSNYTVVYCDESNSQKVWYLFDKNKHSFDKIEGLTSSINGSKIKLKPSRGDWESREWSGIKKYNNRAYKAEEKTEGSFTIALNSGIFDFPFFEKFKNSNCVRSLGYTRPTDPVEFSCQSFNITTDQFTNIHKTQQYKKAFKSNEEKKCYLKYENDKWKETNCQNETTSQK